MKYLSKTIEIGLYLLVFFLPFGTRWIIKTGELNHGPWEYGTYSLYGTDVLLMALILLFIVREIAASAGYGLLAMTEKMVYDNKTIRWFICGLVLASAVSVFFSADKFLAIYKFGWLIMGLGLFWLVVSADYSRLKLIYSMLAGAFLSAGLGIWQFLNQAAFASKWLGLAEHQGIDLGASVIEAVGSDGVGERWLRAYGAMDHPNVLGGVLALGIIFTVYQIIAYEKSSGFSIFDFRFSNKMQNANPPAILRDNFSAQGGSASGRQTIFNDKIFNFINWLMILVFTAALFFSFSRSAWLALAAGLIVIIVFTVAGGNLKRQRALAEIILAMGILVFVVFSQYQNLVVARLNSEGRLETKSNFERLASYKEAWRLIQDDSLIGVGPGNYTLALNRLLPWQESYYYQPTHNVFLLIWSEIGIFGLLSFLGMIVYLIIINFSPFTKASEDKQFFPLRQGFGGQVIFNEGFENLSIGNCLKIVNCKLKIRNSYLAKNLMFNTSVLIALIVLMFFDHWLWSLHFGVLYFWLVLGLVVTPLAKVSPAGAGDFSGKVKYKSP